MRKDFRVPAFQRTNLKMFLKKENRSKYRRWIKDFHAITGWDGLNGVKEKI
jgi:hypothetical protein